MKEEEHLRDVRRVNRRNSNESVFARPNGLRENSEPVMSRRGPGPARKKEVRIPVSSREEEDAQMCPCCKAVESRTHIAGKEEREIWYTR